MSLIVLSQAYCWLLLKGEELQYKIPEPIYITAVSLFRLWLFEILIIRNKASKYYMWGDMLPLPRIQVCNLS